jgi:DNA-binding MarR family transcriptional regulator
MASTKSNVRAEPPLIGALLRICWQSVREGVERDLRGQGFEGIGAAHLPVLQWPSPRGLRVTTLAANAGMSRQAINYLIRELELGGYLQRRRDPSDGRARVVHLTKRGEAAIRCIRASVRSQEGAWEKELGSARFEQFREALIALATGSNAPG